jgi:large repetitive protein
MSVSLARSTIQQTSSPRGSRNRRSKRRFAFEVLESRTVLSTLDIAAGALDYNATLAATNLTVSTTGGPSGAYTFSDADQVIALTAGAMAAGWTGGGTNTVTGPDSSVNSIEIDTGPAANSITINSFANNILIDGGSGTNTLDVTSAVPTLTVSNPGVLDFGAGNPSINYSNVQTIDITKPATPPAGTSAGFSSTEGQPLSNIVVASFTESDLGNAPGNFLATINWGDGSPSSAGTVQLTGANSYNILGSHTYAKSGTFTVDVSLTDLGSMGSTTVGGSSITVTSTGPVNSVPNPILSTASTSAASLSAQGVTVTGTEGKALNPAVGGDVLVATFMDSGTVGSPADYSASINWGDGTTTAPTRITSQGTPNGVVFSVFGNTTYAEEGTYPIAVTITKTASGATAIAAGQAVIADAALTAGAATLLTPNTGELLSKTIVGSFSDANTAAPLGDFTAVIDWGDGSPTSLGTIVSAGGGVFDVDGTHAYATPGVFDTTINVKDVGGSTVTVGGTATVTDAAPTGVPATFTAVEGQSTGSIVLATITDPNPLATVSSLSASIVNWGDGTPASPKPLSVVLIGATSTSTTFQIIGSHTYAEEGLGLPVTLTVTTSGGVATVFTPATGTANVQDARLGSSNGTTIKGIEGTATAAVVLGTFTDSNQGATSLDFLPTPVGNGGSVVVNWGDGSAAETLAEANLSPTPPTTQGAGVFTITATHTYAEEGTYAYTVTVTDDGGATTVISGSAVIADAALTASATQPTVDTTEAGVFPVPQFGKPAFDNQQVASFTDANLTAPLSDFTATIDWGDGTALSAGTVTEPGGVGAAFVVTGSHTYADAGVNGGTGTYPIQVFVVDVGGSKLTVTNIANVADRPIVITGQLNPASDSGVSDTDDITNVKQPDFFGTSEAFSHVSLFATTLGGGPLVPIGQVQAGSNGSWNIVSSVPLADGSYVITASAVDQFGETTGGPTTITSDLVIDTVGPVITNVVWNRLNGQVDYVIQDPSPASGVNMATLLDSSNYLFTKVHANKAFPGKWIVTNIAVSPGAATSSYDVAVTFNDGATIRGGFYLFTIRDSSNGNSSVQDIAGNHLDGVFYGTFPSGNGIPGSDFVTMLSGYHYKIFSPQTLVGTASAANGGVGGPRIGAVHSGDFTPIIPRGGTPVFAPPVAATRHVKVKAAATVHARGVVHDLTQRVGSHPKGPLARRHS